MHKGQRIRVTFDFELPVDATDAEVRDWVELQLGIGSMWTDNPLDNYEYEPIRVHVERA